MAAKRLVIRRSPRPEEDEELMDGIDPSITRAIQPPVIMGTEPEPDYAPVTPVIAAPVFQPEPEPEPEPAIPSWANEPPGYFGQPDQPAAPASTGWRGAGIPPAVEEWRNPNPEPMMDLDIPFRGSAAPQTPPVSEYYFRSPSDRDDMSYTEQPRLDKGGFPLHLEDAWPQQIKNTRPAVAPQPSRPLAPEPKPGPPKATPKPTPTPSRAPAGKIDHSSREGFIASMLPYALEAEARTGIPADIMIAINLNEQGWQHEAPGLNYFGIKGKNPRTGASTGPVSTWEDYGNGRVNIKDTFRAYSSPAESYEDFGNFLRDNSRYRKALEVLEKTGDKAAFIKEVHRAGYATDPLWSNKILNIASTIPTEGGGGTRMSALSVRRPTDFENQPPVDLPPDGIAAPPTYPAGPRSDAPPLVQNPSIPNYVPSQPLLPSTFEDVPQGTDAFTYENRSGLYRERQNLPPGIRDVAQQVDTLGYMAPNFNPNADGLELAMNAIPAVAQTGPIAVRGVSGLAATALDIGSGLLGGPSVVSAREAVEQAARGIARSGIDFGEQLAGIDPLNPMGPRSATLGMSATGVPPIPGGAGKGIPTDPDELFEYRKLEVAKEEIEKRLAMPGPKHVTFFADGFTMADSKGMADPRMQETAARFQRAADELGVELGQPELYDERGTPLIRMTVQRKATPPTGAGRAQPDAVDTLFNEWKTAHDTWDTAIQQRGIPKDVVDEAAAAEQAAFAKLQPDRYEPGDLVYSKGRLDYPYVVIRDDGGPTFIADNLQTQGIASRPSRFNRSDYVPAPETLKQRLGAVPATNVENVENVAGPAADPAVLRGVDDVPPPGTTKQPWEMSQADFTAQSWYHGANPTKAQALRQAGNFNIRKGDDDIGTSFLTTNPRLAGEGGYAGADGEVFVILPSDFGEPSKITGVPFGAELAGRKSDALANNAQDITSLSDFGASASLAVNRSVPASVADQGEAAIHRYLIERALAEGRPVPPEVLAEYPDLAAQIGRSQVPPAGTVDDAAPPVDVPPVAPDVHPVTGHGKLAEALERARLRAASGGGAGQPPTAPRGTGTPQAPLERERGVSVTMAEGPNADAAASFKARPETYVPRRQEDRLVEARVMVDANQQGAIDLILKSDRPMDDVESAVAMTLVDDLFRAGQKDLANEVARHAAKRATAGGQGGAMWAQWDKMSPAGLDYQFAQAAEAWLDAGNSRNSLLQRLNGVGDRNRLLKHMQDSAAEAARVAAQENTARELAEANALLAAKEKELARVKRSRDAFQRRAAKTPPTVKEFLDEFDDFFNDDVQPVTAGSVDLSGGLIPKPPAPKNTIPPDVEKAFRARMEDIKAMDPGPERDALKQQLRADIAAMDTPAAPKATAPKGTPDTDGAGKPKRTREAVMAATQREKDFNYLIDDAVREVETKMTPDARKVIAKVKSIMKHSGAEMTPEEADAFLDSAHALKELADPDIRVAAMTNMVEDVRQRKDVIEGIARGHEIKVTAAAKKQREADLKRFTDANARTNLFTSLRTVDRATVTRVLNLLKRTDVELQWDLAEQVMDDITALRGLAADAQPGAADAILARLREFDPIKEALERKKVIRDTEARAKAAQRTAANDLAKLTGTAPAAGTSPLPAQSPVRKAINGLVAMLRKNEVSLPEDVARQFVADANAILALPPNQQEAAAAALLRTASQYDPILKAAERKKAVDAAQKALEAETRRNLNNLINLTADASSRLAKAGTPTDASTRMAARIKGILDRAGVDGPSLDVAMEWLEEANQLKYLPADSDELKAATEALIAKVNRYDPVHLAQEQKAAVREADRIVKQQEADFKVLTGRAIPDAKTRAINHERKVMAAARAKVVTNGLHLPDEIALNLQGRAAAGKAMAPGMQQERVFQAIMRDINNLTPPSRIKQAWSLLGIPRASQTAWDRSYPFRQGWQTAIRHPQQWLKIWGPMMEAGRDPAFALKVQDEMATRPLANIGNWSGLRFDEYGVADEGADQFGNQILSKIKGYKGSERAYVIPGNMQRTGLYDQFIRNWFPPGTDFSQFKSLAEAAAFAGKTEQDFHNVARAYNVLTGKGSLGWLKNYMPAIGNSIYAPSWLISKIERYEMLLDPRVDNALRMEIASNLVASWATMSSLVAAGVVFGVWDSDADPRSTNFMKVKFKGTDTWIDLTPGGASSLIRLIAQSVPSQRTDGSWGGTIKDATGNYVPQDFGTSLGKFARSNLAPIPGAINDFIQGQDMVGRRRDITEPSDIAQALFRMIGPLSWHNLAEAAWNHGLDDGIIASTQLVGQSTNTYTALNDVKSKVAWEMYPKEMEALARRGEGVSGLPASKQDAIEKSTPVQAKMLQIESGRSDDPLKGADRYEAKAILGQQWAEAKKRMEVGDGTPDNPGLRSYIDAGMTGKALTDQIRKMKTERYIAGQTIYNNSIGKSLDANEKKTMLEILKSAYSDAQPYEDMRTGELDFTQQKQQREQVLRQAEALGIPAADVMDKGQRFDDPMVAKAVEAYEKDMEALRPYFELADELQRLYPALSKAVEQYKATKPGTPERLRAENNGYYKTYNEQLSIQRRTLRWKNPELDEVGIRQERWKPAWNRGGHRAAPTDASTAPTPVPIAPAAPTTPAFQRTPYRAPEVSNR
jgi:hypothetical protein